MLERNIQYKIRRRPVTKRRTPEHTHVHGVHRRIIVFNLNVWKSLHLNCIFFISRKATLQKPPDGAIIKVFHQQTHFIRSAKSRLSTAYMRSDIRKKLKKWLKNEIKTDKHLAPNRIDMVK